MLVVGMTTAVISFSMLGYYTLQFINIIQQEGNYTIEPGRWINVQKNINNTQGIGLYVIAFAEFSGPASVIVMDNAGKTIINKSISQLIAIEPFSAENPGVYTLTLLNPTDQMLEVAIGFGDPDHMLSRKNILFTATALILVSLVVIGIIVALAGIIITISDRARINRMKQFGNTNDLI